MRIYLMRHAEAADATASGHDEPRPLTARGERQAREIGAALAAAGDRPELILASPLVRTRQTGQLVAGLVGARLETWDLLSPGADPERVLAALHDRAGAADTVMLVGHQPDMGALLAHAIGHPHAWPFKKGAVAKVEGGTLAWWRTPKLAGG